MTIHVVQPGETINSISDLYNIPYGVAPMMFISTYTDQGKSSREVVYDFLRNPDAFTCRLSPLIFHPYIPYSSID